MNFKCKGCLTSCRQYIGVLLLCIAIIVLRLLNLKMYVMTLSTTLCIFLLICWISYWIIRKHS